MVLKSGVSALDTIDRTQPAEAEAKTAQLNEKQTKLKRQMRYVRTVETQLRTHPDEQMSLTDPDARSRPLRVAALASLAITCKQWPPPSNT
jgi:flagellar capping protein FliD